MTYSTIYLAGGCFWGMEEYFSRLNGVHNVTSGYANGTSDSTSYRELKITDHAETIHIEYNASIITLQELLAHYFRVIDPFSVNRQGNDRGRQYRTGIYYVDEVSQKEIETFLAMKNAPYTKPFAIEVEPLKHYILAEEYHQDYLKKNPGGYCHIDVTKASIPLSDSEK